MITNVQVLRIETLDDLFEHEREILGRLSAMRHGPNLFVAHPFRALTDVNVVLSDEACRALIRLEPGLAALSSTAYDALRERGVDEQNVRFHLRGLFRRPQ